MTWTNLLQKKKPELPAVELANGDQCEAVRVQLEAALRHELVKRDYPEFALADLSVTLSRSADAPGKIDLQITTRYFGEPWNCEIGDQEVRAVMRAIAHKGGNYQVNKTSFREGPALLSNEDEYTPSNFQQENMQYRFNAYRLADILTTFSQVFPDVTFDPAVLGKAL